VEVGVGVDVLEVRKVELCQRTEVWLRLGKAGMFGQRTVVWLRVGRKVEFGQRTVLLGVMVGRDVLSQMPRVLLTREYCVVEEVLCQSQPVVLLLTDELALEVEFKLRVLEAVAFQYLEELLVWRVVEGGLFIQGWLDATIVVVVVLMT